MSELFDKRAKFSSLIPRIIDQMINDGYTPLIGKDGLKHMKNSLHYDGLAMDIDLFKDGKYLTSTEDHRRFGEFWERLDKDCCWGGRFNDGNHYSVTMEGRK
jgi:hypothetical protein